VLVRLRCVVRSPRWGRGCRSGPRFDEQGTPLDRAPITRPLTDPRVSASAKRGPSVARDRRDVDFRGSDPPRGRRERIGNSPRAGARQQHQRREQTKKAPTPRPTPDDHRLDDTRATSRLQQRTENWESLASWPGRRGPASSGGGRRPAPTVFHSGDGVPGRAARAPRFHRFGKRARARQRSSPQRITAVHAARSIGSSTPRSRTTRGSRCSPRRATRAFVRAS